MRLRLSLGVILALLVTLGTPPSPAGADVLIPPADFDTVDLGDLVDEMTSDIMTADLSDQNGPPSMDIGDVTVRVWLNQGTYTYEVAVLPDVMSSLEFNTSFTVHGFDPLVHRAGYSFSDASAAGCVPPPFPSAFQILFENSSDSSMDWNVRSSQVVSGCWAAAGQQVRFFFQSSRPPSALGTYNLLASQSGGAINLAPSPAPTGVEIDIRPHSHRNRINPNRHGHVRVAILSSDTFDATTVDPTTVRFGATGTEAAPIMWWPHRRPRDRSKQRDVDHDGDVDMVLVFEVADTGIKCGDTSARLTGQTVDGEDFEGTDAITTPRCPKP